MREIKFRAYNKEINKMTYLDPLQWPLKVLVEQENWKVMMWTGLLDRHGREIYEGDILGRESYTNWVVGWKAPSFIIYNITNPESKYTIWNIDIEAREVIGNIYQDSHLLDNHKDV